MGFSRQEYWSGWLCPPAGDLPNPGIKPIKEGSCVAFEPALFASPQVGGWAGKPRKKGWPLLVCIPVAWILKWLLTSSLKPWSFSSQISLALKWLPSVNFKATCLYFLCLLSTASCWYQSHAWPWAGLQFSHWYSTGRIDCSDQGQRPWTWRPEFKSQPCCTFTVSP